LVSQSVSYKRPDFKQVCPRAVQNSSLTDIYVYLLQDVIQCRTMNC